MYLVLDREGTEKCSSLGHSSAGHIAFILNVFSQQPLDLFEWRVARCSRGGRLIAFCSSPLVSSVVPPGTACRGARRMFALRLRACRRIHPRVRRKVGCTARSECVAWQTQLALRVHDPCPRGAPAPCTELSSRQSILALLSLIAT